MQILNKNALKNLSKTKYFNVVKFKDEKTQKFTTLILTLAALSILGLFAINPTLSTIIRLQKELDDNQLIEQKLSQKINNLTNLQRQYVELRDDLPIVYAAIPKTPEAPLLIAQIQSAAQNSDITLINVQTFQVEIEKPGVQKKYSSFSFSLTADGEYDNLMQFLDDLTNMERIVAVDIISITEQTGETNLQLTFKGRAFFNK
jgi:Tfp pilus assembly protein PilO